MSFVSWSRDQISANHSSPAPWVDEAPRLLDGAHLVLLVLGHDAHTDT